MNRRFEIRHGHALAVLQTLPNESVHCCITSPPYWGLRDYGVEPVLWDGDSTHRHEWGPEIIVNATNHVDKRRWNHAYNGRGEKQPLEKQPGCERHKIGQGEFCACGAWRGALGLEPTPELYVTHVVSIFRELRRVLRADGTLWLVLGGLLRRILGQSRSTRYKGCTAGDSRAKIQSLEPYPKQISHTGSWVNQHPTLKPKDLIGVPWRVALALQADGWYLRSDIIWAKTNPMPESVSDRPTKSHEYICLLSKCRRYFYDATAIREPFRHPERTYKSNTQGQKTARLSEQGNRCTAGLHDGRTRYGTPALGLNKRSVWTIATEPYSGAHFATYPNKLIAPCMKAGTSESGCCPHCGAPWRRVLRKTAIHPVDCSGKWSTAAQQADGRRMEVNVRVRGQAGEARDWPLSPPMTMRGRPNCAHKGPPVPCTVLDPFSGSGTTGIVALGLGRRFIGIELNSRYVKMALSRIAADAPVIELDSGKETA